MVASNDKVVYVEPNFVNDFTSYDSVNMGEVYKSVSHEDMCIVVGLEVEIKSRSAALGQDSEGNIITLNWQSSASGEKASFTEGSKIYTTPERDEYIKALTTNYTDSNLFGVQEVGSGELFGIKSIEISYVNFRIPEVTIQFVDVRGVSLFAQEEMRHNMIQYGVSGSVNKDIEGSFFKSFFTFPYPKYTLKVKGFYGEMVSYELTCTKFQSSFDSNTGNFNVTATFIGYTFSFLTDIMVNYLTAAPYSEYFGKSYWEENVNNSRFVLEGANGANNIPMPTLVELCGRYDAIREEASRIVEELGPDKILEQNGGTPEEIKAVSGDVEAMNSIAETYASLIEDLDSVYYKLQGKNASYGNASIKPSGTNSYAFIFDDDGDTDLYDEVKVLLNSLQEKFNDFSTEIGKVKFAGDDSNIIKEHTFKIYNYDDYSSILASKETGAINKDIIEEDILREAIQEKGGEKVPLRNETYHEVWYDGSLSDASDVYFYQDWGLKNILGRYMSKDTTDSSEKQSIIDKATNIALAQATNDILKFPPTVENITKIIMAHVETFVKTVSQCVKNINSAENPRTTNSLGIDTSSLADINNTLGNDENTTIPPFPLFKVWRDENGVKKEEEEWAGDVNGINSDNFEEIKLVEGFLNGVTKVKDYVNRMNLKEFTQEPTEMKFPIKHPLTYYDLFLNDGQTPFGKVGDFDLNMNEIFARFCVRAFGVFATQNYENRKLDAACYGMADAENFIDYFGINDIYASIGGMVDSVTVESIINFLKDGTKKIDQSKTGSVWGNYSNKLIEYNGEQCKLSIGTWGENEDSVFKPHQIFPIIDWGFTDFSHVKDGKVTTKNFTNCVVTPCLNDDVVCECVKIEENNVSRFKKMYDSSMSSVIGGTNKIVEKIFNYDNGFEIERSNAIEYHVDDPSFSKYKTADYLLNNKHEGYQIKELKHDENGNVLNFSDYSINFRNYFLSKDYVDVRGEDVLTRAAKFLSYIFPNYMHTVLYDKIIHRVKSANFVYATKFDVLNLGASFLLGYLSNKRNDGGGKRPSLAKVFKDYFINWANTEYKDVIESNYALSLPNRTLSNLREVLKDKDNLENEEKALSLITSWMNSDSVSKFRELYTVKIETKSTLAVFESKEVFLATNPNTSPMNKIMKSLNKIVAVSTISKFNENKENFEGTSNYQTTVNSSAIEGYFSGVLQVLKNELGKISENENGQDGNQSISLNRDEVDIKHGVYSHLKLLYDRWLATGEEERVFNFDKMFNGPNPEFHFIDSFYNKIGKTTYLDLASLVSDIVQSQTNSQYPLYSMLANMYSKNKMMIMCINNFLDLSNPVAMENMFKPLSYLDYHEPMNHMNFVVLLPYEPSKRLNIQGADFSDDGFYLNKEEYTWPKMIRNKNTGIDGDLSIPAFGVSYGQQYQNYFKDIQVGTNSPIATEQSVAAKFLISGANRVGKNESKSIITYGQDLYSIYSNNSYTCTVTMMGCAWVQPMMCFVLTNIPMFCGTYQIIRVRHSIQPGFMTTTFTGVRMAKTVTRSVKNFILGGSVDSVGQYGPDSNTYMTEGSSNANISNDCPYAYRNPIQRNVVNVSENDRQAYCYSVYSALMKIEGIEPHHAKGICANIVAESSFDPYVATIDGNSTTHGLGGGLCGFYTRGNGMGIPLFNFIYGETVGPEMIEEYNKKIEHIWKENPVPCSQKNTDRLKEEGIVYPIDFEDQKRFIVYCITNLGYGKIKGTKTEVEATNWWMSHYERPSVKDYKRWEKHGNWVESAINSKMQIDNTISTTSATTNVTVDDVASGLTDSFTVSLKASQYYGKTTVNMKSIGGGKYEYTAYGVGANNALFDCAVSTYSQWFDEIEWNVGNTAINHDSLSVIIHIVANFSENAGGSESTANAQGPTLKIVGYNDGQTSMISCQTTDDINDSLKMTIKKVLMKRLGDLNAQDGTIIESNAKHICPSLNPIEVGKLEEIFKDGEESSENGDEEKKKSSVTIESCDSLMGCGNVKLSNEDDGKGGIYLKEVTSLYKPNNDTYYMKSAFQELRRHNTTGQCAYAVRCAIDRAFCTNPNDSSSYTSNKGASSTLKERPVSAWKYVYFLPQMGFKLICTTDNSGKGGYVPQVGDIAVYQKFYSREAHGHICMYTDSNRWKSDFWQNNLIVYPDKTLTAYIFRYGGPVENEFCQG